MKNYTMVMTTLALATASLVAQDKKIEVSTVAKNPAPVAAKVEIKTEPVEVRTGYVDSAIAMRNSKEGAKMSEELEKKREQLSNDLKKEETTLIKDMESFKTRSMTMSELERDAEQKRLIKAERELKSKVEEAELELKMAMQRTMEALGKEIEAAVKDVAVAQNLDVVIDIRTGQTLYAANNVVYTDSLVKEMDKNYNVKLAKNNTTKKQITT